MMITLTDKINNYDLSQLAEYTDIMLHSNCDDVIDIKEITQNIKSNFLNWVKSGILLNTVKKEFSFLVLKNKLAKNWKEYCLKFFNKTHWYVDNIIKASQVVLILIKNGFKVLPTCENQAKPLTRLLPDHEQMNIDECNQLEQEICDLWQQVIIKSEGKAITGNLVKSVVDPDSVDNKNKGIKVDSDTFEKLQKQALDAGFKNVTDYLTAIANNQITIEENTIEEVEQEKVEQWEKDLTELVEEEEENSKILVEIFTNLVKENQDIDLNCFNAKTKQLIDDNCFKYWQLDIFGNRQPHQFT